MRKWIFGYDVMLDAERVLSEHLNGVMSNGLTGLGDGLES